MKNKDFLKWIYDRMVNIHNENPNLDYMHKFKYIIYGNTEVFIVLDLDASDEDIIWDVCSTKELAEISENNLKQQRVGGALTKIIHEQID